MTLLLVSVDVKHPVVSLRIRIADVDINNDTMQKFDQFLGQASQGGSIIKGIIAAASNMEPF